MPGEKERTLQSLVEKCQKADLSGFPDIGLYDSDKDRALYVLWVAKDLLGEAKLTLGQVLALLVKVFEVSIPETTLGARLSEARTKRLIHADGRRGKKRFSLMRAGRERLKNRARDLVLVIDPAQPYKAFESIAGWLGSFAGKVRICDPYFDKESLPSLDQLSSASEVHYLTAQRRDAKRALRVGAYRAYRAQHPKVEVRERSEKDLHDRYIIDDHEMFLVGTSLNGLGKKQAFIVRMGEDIRAQMLSDFGEKWRSANRLA